MSQVIDVCIQSAEAEIDLWKKHPGEQFCYSIKTIVGCDGSSAESEHSCTAMVLLNRLHGSLKELPQGGPAEKTSDKKYSTNINPKSRAQEC